MEKICSHCKNSFDISLFQKHVNTKDGLGSWCKNCIRDKSAEKRREKGIEPRRIGIDSEKQKIRLTTYKKNKASTFIYTITEKICSHCQISKSAKEFRKRIVCKDGYSNKCKKCERIIQKESYQNYRNKNWAKALIYHAKNHSKTEILIDENFVLELFEKQNGLCHWFKVKLQPSSEPKYPWQPSLDRLDRTKGYEPGNVVLTCYSANIGRNTASAEIFNLFVIDLKMAFKD